MAYIPMPKGRGFTPRLVRDIIPLFASNCKGPRESPSALCDVPVGIGVERHIRRVPGQIFVIGLTADHGAIVPAQGERRQVEAASGRGTGRLQVRADVGIGRHAPRHRHLAAAAAAGGLHDPGDQHIADRCGKGGG